MHLVRNYVPEWLTKYGRANLKPATIRGYEMYSRNYIIPFIGDYPIDELTPYIIQNWIYDLQITGRVKSSEKLNPKTVIQAYRILSRSLSFAVRVQFISLNPCFGVELPRKKKYRYVWLHTYDEILEFIQAFYGTRFYYPVVFAISLGLRLGELLGLKRSDFDFNCKTLTVSRSVCLTPESGKVVVDDSLKSETSFRTILVPDLIFEILKDMPDYEYLFGRSDGSVINPSTFSKIFGKKRDSLGVRHVRFHDLRHSYATIFILIYA